MGDVQRFLVPPFGTTAGDRSALDRDAAVRFLQQQSACLREGLLQGGDPAAVVRVLDAHDASHPEWIALIAALRTVGDSATADAAATVYGFHGRVAGSLERGPDTRLTNEVCADVRGLLAEGLQHMTDTLVAAVSAPVRGGSRSSTGRITDRSDAVASET